MLTVGNVVGRESIFIFNIRLCAIEEERHNRGHVSSFSNSTLDQLVSKLPSVKMKTYHLWHSVMRYFHVHLAY